jgi:hypothetical protein
VRALRLIFILVFAYAVSYLAIDLLSFVHRRDFDNAFSGWYRNPTAENEAALRKEEEINKAIRINGDALGAAILVSVGYGIYALFGRVRKSR